MRYIIIPVLLALIGCSKTPPPPTPVGPLPTEAQLEWQNMEMNMFIHFNMNTFTNMEWGLGGESPELFNPTQLDTRQWAAIAKAAGMKGIILTAKHHDGFCLWPSEYTEHSVKNSPWKDGKGDVIRELADACKEYGLKLGLYLSPWDRNHAEYGRPEYLEYFRKQMQELLTNYGEVFEFWVDGANGGTGYYGGANEERKIDRTTYYEWDSTFALAKSLQPEVIIFSDGGPGCRWVGNESGWAAETNWSLLREDEFAPGVADVKALQTGQEEGTKWIPAEVNTSIRPGWYYHEFEDHKVKSLSRMVDTYYESVGRNGLFLLNFPVDKRGLIHPTDSARIMEMVAVINRDFERNIAKGAFVSASNVRAGDSTYSPFMVIDGDPDTYWSTDDLVNKASIEIDLKNKRTFNRILLQEYIRLGQRVRSFTVEYLVGDEWKLIDEQTTIGYKRILRFPNVTGSKVRVSITSSKASPVISNIGVYKAPKLLVEPQINRNKDGFVSMSVPDSVPVYYTLDRSEPTDGSVLYTEPFLVEEPTTLKAVAKDPETDNYSAVNTQRIDIPKEQWKVISTSSGNLEKAQSIIDANVNTWWQTDNLEGKAAEIIVDLGGVYTLSGITYTPTQTRFVSGFIRNYEVYAGTDTLKFGRAVAKGEFSNILNNPVKQEVRFRPKKARYIKFVALEPIEEHNTAGFAELGIITESK